MDFDVSSVCFSDFLSGNTPNWNDLKIFLGNQLDYDRHCKISFAHSSPNHWVWLPNISTFKISNAIYNFLNQDFSNGEANWVGWHKLWRLHVVPRVKIFLWRMLHGRTLTFSYYYRLTLGLKGFSPFVSLKMKQLIMSYGDARKSGIAGTLLPLIWVWLFLMTNFQWVGGCSNFSLRVLITTKSNLWWA